MASRVQTSVYLSSEEDSIKESESITIAFQGFFAEMVGDILSMDAMKINSMKHEEESSKKSLKFFRKIFPKAIENLLLEMYSPHKTTPKEYGGLDSLAQNFLDEEGKLTGKSCMKIERFYAMYETAIIHRCKYEIEKHTGSLEKDDVKVIIKNVCTLFLYTLGVYTDTLSPTQFENALLGKLSTGGPKNHMDLILEHKGHLNNYKILNERPDLLRMYRKNIGSGFTAHSINDAEMISASLQRHCDESFVSLVEIFKILRSGVKFNSHEFLLLGTKITKLKEDASFLSENNIGFHSLIKENILNTLYTNNFSHIKKMLNGVGEIDDFKYFLDTTPESLEDYISHLKEQIQEDHEVVFEKIDTKSLDDLHFSEYSKAGALGRKRYFLQKILHISADKKIGKNHSIPCPLGEETGNIASGFSEFYAQNYEEHNLSQPKVFELLLQAYNHINDIGEEEIDLKTYETQFLEEEQILVAWFRFWLMWKSTSGEKSDQERMIELATQWHGMYGSKELFFSKIEKDGTYPSFIKGTNHNLSGWTMASIIDHHDFKFQNGTIDITNGKFSDSDGKLFLKTKQLFNPAGKSDKSHHYENFYTSRIDLLNIILQRDRDKKTQRKSLDAYKRELTTLGIDITDLDQIFMLRDFLKYCLYCSRKVKDMLAQANQDSEALGVLIGEKYIGPEKDFRRIMEKLMMKYGGDLRMLGDLSRARVISTDYFGSIDDLGKITQKLSCPHSGVEQVIVEDKTGNANERSIKGTGYRDLVLNVRLESGNLCEIQFITQKMYEYKGEGIDTAAFFTIAKNSFVSFDDNDYNTLKSIAKEYDISLHEGFRFLKSSYTGNRANEIQKLTGKISSDDIYVLSRNTPDNTNLQKILVKLESLPYLSFWGEEVYNLSLKALEEA